MKLCNSFHDSLDIVIITLSIKQRKTKNNDKLHKFIIRYYEVEK